MAGYARFIYCFLIYNRLMHHRQTTRSSSSRFLDTGEPREKLERLPLLKNAAKEDIEDLFIRKVRQCRVVFDFTKSLSDVQQKEIKRETLLELVEFVMTDRGFLTPQIYHEVIDMVRSIDLFCLLLCKCSLSIY